MIRLPATLSAWGTPGFEQAFKREIEELGAYALPLQRCLSAGSCVLPLPIEVILLEGNASNGRLYVRAGISFKSTVAGCSCADDPNPPNELHEYGELRFEIDLSTASAVIIPAEN